MGIILKSFKGDKSRTSFIVQAEFAEDIEGFGQAGKSKTMKSTTKEKEGKKFNYSHAMLL
jgi:hypothetical protein